MIPLSDRSTIQRYTPKNTDVRITTIVVAYTSRWLGQVTRPISLRTSERKRRERPHHPVTLPRARPPNESPLSSTIALGLHPCLLLVLRRAVVAPLALGAGEADDVSHLSGARGRGFAAVPSGPSLTLTPLRGRFAGRSVPFALNAECQYRMFSAFGIQHSAFIPRFPRSSPRRPCGRLHESRTARPARARSASSAQR